MNKWKWTTTLLLAGCATLQPVTGRAVLILKPAIAHSEITQAIIDPYSSASINHLTLKLYTVNGAETDTEISRTILQAQLDNPIMFSSLKANTHYRVKAFAYSTSDDSQLISTTDADSYVDVTLVTDDRPTFETLKVKLVDRPFNFQSTSSFSFVAGGLDHPATPDFSTLGMQGIVSTFAGSGASSNLDDTGTLATIKSPQNLAMDSDGNLYVTCLYRVRKIDKNGVVTTIAGGDATGIADGTGSGASFLYPRGITLDNAGHLYVADGNRIRQVSMDGSVLTVAGATDSGKVDGYAASASFSTPYDITFDGSRYLYVADYNNRLVRRIDPTDGFKVETLAGSNSGYLDGVGTSAMFYYTTGITMAPDGYLYLSEYSSTINGANSRIRRLDPVSANVSTFAGPAAVGISGGTTAGFGTTARLSVPRGIAMDLLGNLYVADNKSGRIRRIAPNGYVSTLSGFIGAGFADGSGTACKFSAPTGIAVDASGTVYVADTSNHRIRKIQ